jgi:hypothetical protein
VAPNEADRTPTIGRRGRSIYAGTDPAAATETGEVVGRGRRALLWCFAPREKRNTCPDGEGRAVEDLTPKLSRAEGVGLNDWLGRLPGAHGDARYANQYDGSEKYGNPS